MTLNATTEQKLAALEEANDRAADAAVEGLLNFLSNTVKAWWLKRSQDRDVVTMISVKAVRLEIHRYYCYGSDALTLTRSLGLQCNEIELQHQAVFVFSLEANEIRKFKQRLAEVGITLRAIN